MKWFRFYSEVLDDPKVQLLPDRLFRHWVNLLCLANEGEPRGTLPDLTAIAFRLRISEDEAQEALNEFARRGLIDPDGSDGPTPHNWDTRQRRSDSSAERVAAHRERQRAAANKEEPAPPVTRNATRNVTVTPLDTDKERDTETETDAEKTTEPRAASAPSSDPPRLTVVSSDEQPDTPFGLCQVLCEENGVAWGDVAPAGQKRQLGIGKRLLDEGFGAAKTRACIRYLRSQSWRTGGIDLGTVLSEGPKWELQGCPPLAQQPARASPGGRRRGDSLSPAQIADIARQAERDEQRGVT